MSYVVDFHRMLYLLNFKTHFYYFLICKTCKM